jgi:cytochrome c oxidase cbb3-type subunit 4
MMITVFAMATVVAMGTFIGIVCWAWSKGRQPANRDAALLPFALPDEAESSKTGH